MEILFIFSSVSYHEENAERGEKSNRRFRCCTEEIDAGRVKIESGAYTLEP